MRIHVTQKNTMTNLPNLAWVLYSIRSPLKYSRIFFRTRQRWLRHSLLVNIYQLQEARNRSHYLQERKEFRSDNKPRKGSPNNVVVKIQHHANGNSFVLFQCRRFSISEIGFFNRIFCRQVI